jgi:hypothetical protein
MFRYYYRSWDQLRGLGLLDQNLGGTGEENDLPVIEPQETGISLANEAIRVCNTINKESEDIFQDYEENFDDQAVSATNARGQTRSSSSPTRPKFTMRRKPSTHRASLRLVGEIEQPCAYVPRGAPSVKADLPVGHVEEHAQPCDRFTRTPTQVYRLSIPPSITLGPPEPSVRPLPTLPVKDDFEAPTSYCLHPAYPVDDWAVRTPSSVKSIRDGITTPPPPGRRKEQSRSTSALKNVFRSAWRRGGTQMPDGTVRTDSRGDAQSLP